MGAGEDQGDGEEPALATAVRSSGPLYPKLRPGPGRSTDQVVANQRARLSGAMVELVAERGYGGITVRGLSRLAGVSTKTFYECFQNVEDCFAATYGRIVRDTLKRAGESSSEPEANLRTRLQTFFAVLSVEPKAARLVLVDALLFGPSLLVRARASSRALERFIGDEFAIAAGPIPLQPEIADGAAAAALYLARTRLLSDDPKAGSAIADEFADWLLSLRGGAALRAGRAVPLGRPVLELRPELGDDRSFLLAAVTRLSVREGYACLTVPAICREAGVSRRIFDQHFDGIADCFLAAVESLITDSLGNARAHAAGADNWERTVVRVIVILCTEIARAPRLAHLALVEVLTPGEPGLRLRDRMIVRLARILRRIAPANARPGRLAAEASVAAAFDIAASGGTAAPAERLGRAAPAAAFVILAPATGPVAAERAIAAELRAMAREHGVIKHSTDFS